MIFNLLIKGSPFSTRACQSALRFAQTAHANGHQIRQVFFYEDAVLIANRLIYMPSKEQNIQADWQSLGASLDLPLQVCIAASIRRGVLSDEEANRHEKGSQGNLAHGFELCGLGSFSAACSESDQTLTFGG